MYERLQHKCLVHFGRKLVGILTVSVVLVSAVNWIDNKQKEKSKKIDRK